jgi:hypothetical protein
MGYDLRPRNKNLESFHFGAFSWAWMLEAGVGWIIGTGRGYKPAQYIEKARKDGKSVNTNDGAHVTAKEAKEMARFCRHLVRYQRMLSDFYGKESESERAEMERIGRALYNIPVRKDFVDMIDAFADWAEKSGGFWVR